MSVVGLDVGNENCRVGVAKQRGIDVVLNDESKRETPLMVSFGEKQRFLGTAAAASATMNPKNTISQIKRLIGRKFKDPEVQRDLSRFSFIVTEGLDGDPLINVQYLNEHRTFTPTQILAMVLSNLKSIAEKNLGTSVVDCVVGIPVFFTELQRRAYLDAAYIAGLHPLRLMHETAATALAFGIYRTDWPENEAVNVVFVDVGHASMQVCVVAFRKGQLQVLGTSFDRSLGGRDFDEVLFNYFAEKFVGEYSINVLSNARACHRLRTSCEKVKKILSANPEAPLNIECLMDEKDVRGFIKRDDFERLSVPILERVKGPCEKALAESKLSVDKISHVELVGSGSRVPALVKIVASFFGKEPSRTLNASECIARGCSLQCAMLSPTFRVREFEVQDTYPFPIALSWKGSAPAPESDTGDELSSNSVVFVKGNPVPSTKMLTIFRSGTFGLDALYADTSELPAVTPQKISSFQIGPFFPSKPNEMGKLKVKIRLNLHGVVSIESSTLIEEEEAEAPKGVKEAPVEQPKEPMDTEAAAGDVKTEDADGQTRESTSENGISDEKPTKMDTEPAKPEVTKKKKAKRTDVPVQEMIVGGLPRSDLQKAFEKEYEMALQDRVMEETKDRKNAVEAYVYDMRNKLYEKLADYVTEQEREDMSSKLQLTEDWLYDEGEDETKSVYVSKLAELKRIGDHIEERQKEEETRAPAVSELRYCLASFRDAAHSKDPKYDHIDAADKAKVITECIKAEDWLQEKLQQQEVLPKAANPVLHSADIKKKTEVLDRFCKPVMTKSRPLPPKPAPAQPEGKGAEATTPNAANGPSSGADAPPTEPMETESSTQETDTMQTD